MGVHHVDHLMTPERNLELQTRIISNARAFVGTYGGLAYLAPFYGVPSFAFYSTEAELVPAHLDIGWRLSRLMGVPASASTRAPPTCCAPCSAALSAWNGGHYKCRPHGAGGRFLADR